MHAPQDGCTVENVGLSSSCAQQTLVEYEADPAEMNATDVLVMLRMHHGVKANWAAKVCNSSRQACAPDVAEASASAQAVWPPGFSRLEHHTVPPAMLDPLHHCAWSAERRIHTKYCTAIASWSTGEQQQQHTPVTVHKQHAGVDRMAVQHQTQFGSKAYCMHACTFVRERNAVDIGACTDQLAWKPLLRDALPQQELQALPTRHCVTVFWRRAPQRIAHRCCQRSPSAAAVPRSPAL